MSNAIVLAGPIDATIYATSNRPEAILEATVEDVAPDGTSTPLSTGALLGSQRALDTAATWWAADGRPMLPFHPYSRESAAPVPVGTVARFDIEVYPTFAQIEAGHRIRLTLTTADTPHLLPTLQQYESLVGGRYGIQRNAAAASFLELQTAPPSAFATACSVCLSTTP
jgi:predicted acyl esterase